MGKQHPGQSLDRPANLPAKVWPALRQALALDPAALRPSANSNDILDGRVENRHVYIHLAPEGNVGILEFALDAAERPAFTKSSSLFGAVCTDSPPAAIDPLRTAR
ncbi:TPA: hypothetical protein U8251_002449 [Pseudomonas putida]|nr:hypothetical protein [Pseudomonas putida]